MDPPAESSNPQHGSTGLSNSPATAAPQHSSQLPVMETSGISSVPGHDHNPERNDTSIPETPGSVHGLQTPIGQTPVGQTPIGMPHVDSSGVETPSGMHSGDQSCGIESTSGVSHDDHSSGIQFQTPVGMHCDDQTSGMETSAGLETTSGDRLTHNDQSLGVETSFGMHYDYGDKSSEQETLPRMHYQDDRRTPAGGHCGNQSSEQETPARMHYEDSQRTASEGHCGDHSSEQESLVQVPSAGQSEVPVLHLEPTFKSTAVCGDAPQQAGFVAQPSSTQDVISSVIQAHATQQGFIPRSVSRPKPPPYARPSAQPPARPPARPQHQPHPPLAPPVSARNVVDNKIDERLLVGRQASMSGEKQEGEMLARCEKEYSASEENYLRGCKWSPDGRMLMTNSNDNIVRIFDVPNAVFDDKWDVNTELRSQQRVSECDLIYDFTWFPGMDSSNPDTCLFATTVREIPIHMFSAVTGKLVCSYLPYNQVDEIVAAHSIGFTSDGKYLVAGFNRKLRCFDTNRPGRECVVTSTVIKEKAPFSSCVKGQRGILSCFAAHPTQPNIIAAGAFNGDVAIYDVPHGGLTAVFEGQPGGITHVAFSKDGNYLFAGGRKDPEINCFDIRNPEKILYVLHRHVATNQRMYFDIDRSSQFLLSGNHNGNVTTFDLKGEIQANHILPWPRLDPISHFTAHSDTVNGLHINPRHPVVATCSGQRHFPESIFRDEDDDPLDPCDVDTEENSLKLWTLKLP